MATNSRSAGFLAPTNTIPQDQDFEDLLIPTVAGITGLDPNTGVRPRWQENPPTQPDRETNWIALGINRVISDTQAAAYQKDANNMAVRRTQEVEVLLSFYGPNAGNLAEVFRDGLQIGQNRDLLTASGIGIVDIGEARKAPALFKELFLVKYDMTWIVRRLTERLYPVLPLVSATGTLNTDPVGSTPIQINVTQ